MTNKIITQPFGIIRAVHTFLDPLSSRALSSADKRTRDAFYAALPDLIPIHFRCEPSDRLSLNDQHLALTISSTPRAVALGEGAANSSNRPQHPVHSFVASPDLKVALLASGADFFLWDLEKQEPIHKFEGQGELLEGCDLSPDKTWAITCCDEGVKIWDLENKMCVKTLTQQALMEADRIHILPTEDPEDKKIAVVGTSLQIWDLNKEKCLFNCPVEPWNNDLVFSPDGKNVFFRKWDGEVVMQSLVDAKSKHVITPEIPINAMTLNNQGTKLYTADNESIQIWDVNTRKLLQTIATNLWMIEKIEVSADETKLITTESTGCIKVWHLPSGKKIEGFFTRQRVILQKITPDGTKFMLISNGLEIRSINLAPLPHEIICDVARDCLRVNANTILKFKVLPSFVKKNIGSNTVSHSHFRRGIAHQRLCEYSESDLMPNIVELYQRMTSAKSTKERQDYNKSASYRFSLLPEATQNLVYNRLFKIHVAKGKWQRTDLAQENYGFLAFYTGGDIESTLEERIMALKGIEVETTPSIKPVIRKRKSREI